MHSCYSSAVPDWLIFMIAASVIVSAGAGLAIRGALWFGAVVVAMVPARRLLQRVALEHVLTAALAISLTALAVLFISTHSAWTVGRIGLGPVVLAAV